MIVKFKAIALYNIKELSIATGLCTQTFRRWINDGKIKGQKTGKRYLISGSELNKIFRFLNK